MKYLIILLLLSGCVYESFGSITALKGIDYCNISGCYKNNISVEISQPINDFKQMCPEIDELCYEDFVQLCELSCNCEDNKVCNWD